MSETTIFTLPKGIRPAGYGPDGYERGEPLPAGMDYREDADGRGRLVIVKPDAASLETLEFPCDGAQQ